MLPVQRRPACHAAVQRLRRSCLRERWGSEGDTLVYIRPVNSDAPVATVVKRGFGLLVSLSTLAENFTFVYPLEIGSAAGDGIRTYVENMAVDSS